MILEVYADVICGWAYVGKRRLEQALARLDPQTADDLTVLWRPYLIDPTAPSPSVPLSEAWQDPAVQAALQQCSPGVEASISRLEVGQLAHELGIGPRWDPQWRASSWAAHRMITAAADRGAELQDALVEALLHAHFVDGADLNRLDLLEELADRFGLPGPVAGPPGTTALRYLEPGFPSGDQLERDTREAHLMGQAYGVAQSPTFVVDGRIVAAGAQPPEVLADAITATAAEPPQQLPDEVRRFRAARTLLEARNPRGCLYLLQPLRPEYDGVRGFETLTARALAASASLEPARAKLEELLEAHPDDAYLHVLMGKTLKRMHDPRAAKHLALAAAMNPEYLDF